MIVPILRRCYTLLFALATPLLLARLWWRSRRLPGYSNRWLERLGYYDRAAPRKGCVWIHAVSVGESVAAVPLVRGLAEHYGSEAVLMTTTTPTGADTLARMLGSAVPHVYFPYDLPSVLRRFLERFQPRLLVVLETELWPNTTALCREHGVPVVLVNARLSERSLRAYQRVAPLSRALVGDFTRIAAQSDEDRRRFVTLGAAAERVMVFGNLKFDLDLPASLHEEAEALRRELGNNRPILVAGSTRDGEEAQVLEALAIIRARMPATLLVLVPRHPERFDEVAGLCRAAGERLARRSEGGRCDDSTGIYLVDTMGELPRFYAAADVAFVGGSLLPFGGHNVLEPASLGTPVLSGPHTFNFAATCRLLADGGALRIVTDAPSLADAALDWLSDSNERDRVGTRGREIVRAHRGATVRTLELIQNVLEESNPSIDNPAVETR